MSEFEDERTRRSVFASRIDPKFHQDGRRCATTRGWSSIRQWSWVGSQTGLLEACSKRDATYHSQRGGRRSTGSIIFVKTIGKTMANFARPLDWRFLTRIQEPTAPGHNKVAR